MPKPRRTARDLRAQMVKAGWANGDQFALTTAGAADLVARELRAHERQGAFADVPPNAFAAIRRAVRVLDACAADLNGRPARAAAP